MTFADWLLWTWSVTRVVYSWSKEEKLWHNRWSKASVGAEKTAASECRPSRVEGWQPSATDQPPTPHPPSRVRRLLPRIISRCDTTSSCFIGSFSAAVSVNWNVTVVTDWPVNSSVRNAQHLVNVHDLLARFSTRFSATPLLRVDLPPFTERHWRNSCDDIQQHSVKSAYKLHTSHNTTGVMKPTTRETRKSQHSQDCKYPRRQCCFETLDLLTPIEMSF